MSSEQVTPQPPAQWETAIESRRQRADYHFKETLRDQRTWYSDKAKEQKRRHLAFAIVVIVAGAVISILQVFGETEWLRISTAILGALVALTRGLDGLLHPGETWQAYRKASEGMKREHRLYVCNADVYFDAPDEDAAFRLFVTRVETVIAEEQQLFWQAHAKVPNGGQAPAAESGGDGGSAKDSDQS